MIIDYLMDGTDGISVLETVRNSEDSPNPFLPIMMITGFAEPKVVFRARDAGVNEFVAKPVSVESIANRLTLMIDKARPFVRSKGYFGPDRRRRRNAPPESPQRRATDNHEQRPAEEPLAIVD